MRTVRWASGMVAAAMVFPLFGARPVAADVVSDRAAAIVLFPQVVADSRFADTVIQLSNTSSQPILAHCFYENANSHCSNTGEICFEASECCNADSCGRCEAGWNEVDFLVRLTPFQPLGWRATEGLEEFPLDGVSRTGRGGSSNAGSRIPPLPEDPFDGVLKCVSINNDGTPSDRNVLKGESTLVGFRMGSEVIVVSKSNAIGIQAIEGAVNQDKTLVLGGPDAEYNGCSEILILDHFFDLATSPVFVEGATPAEIETVLTLVPCTENLRTQTPGKTVVQFLVYNEFEQRFSASTTVECKYENLLSLIETTQRERSIFSVGVAGTLAGQTRIHPLSGGLVGVALEVQGNGIAEFNLHKQGNREDPDIITLP
jgi:hypothetical protein